jgi:hypothetical protein
VVRRLGYDHAVVQLTRRLGLPTRGDCLPRLRHYALSQIKQTVGQWHDPIESLAMLLQVVAGRLSVCLKFIHTYEDVQQIAREQAAFSPTLGDILSSEFLRGTTEGLLIEHQNPQPGDRRYLAVIDARGERAARAYFTAWHELSHLLVLPPQLELKLFRRSPTPEQIKKDPLESVVDDITGLAAFYDPIFSPALERNVNLDGRMTFGAIARTIEAVAPGASLYAAAIAAVRVTKAPLCFLSAEPRFKPAESRQLKSPQSELGLGLGEPPLIPKLRVVDIVANDKAREQGIGMHPNLRVPISSIIYKVFTENDGQELEADEDQSWWVTTSSGALPELALRVNALRRGGRAYGLIRLADSATSGQAAS